MNVMLIILDLYKYEQHETVTYNNEASNCQICCVVKSLESAKYYKTIRPNMDLLHRFLQQEY